MRARLMLWLIVWRGPPQKRNATTAGTRPNAASTKRPVSDVTSAARLTATTIVIHAPARMIFLY